MTCNFLKLNESKTKVIEILSYRKIESRIISNIQIDDSYSLPMPNAFVKILGVVFDDRLNLEKHINSVVSTCYGNLRNLGRIASKLTKPLKIQLVHSLILSHIDDCNALFYNLPEYLLHKLTKVLYSAVRFIFGLRGSALRKHMQWRIQKILVGGDLKHKTSKIRMSSPKLRVIFRPKSETQTFFSPKFRWSPKKKKKKRSSPKLRLIFRRISYV